MLTSSIVDRQSSIRGGGMESNGQRRRVVVTGLGAVTALGLNVAENWEAAVAGKSGADYITLFDAKGGGHETHFACEVKGFDPTVRMTAKEARRTDRVIQFAVVAAYEAAESARLEINETNAE